MEFEAAGFSEPPKKMKLFVPLFLGCSGCDNTFSVHDLVLVEQQDGKLVYYAEKFCGLCIKTKGVVLHAIMADDETLTFDDISDISIEPAK